MKVTIEQAQECLKNIAKMSREIEFLKSENNTVEYFNLPKVPGITEYKDLVTSRLNTLYTIRAHILEAISKIENIDYRTLLELKYLSTLSITKISFQMYYSDRTLWYMHKKALTELAKHLDKTIIIETDNRVQDKQYYIKCGICGERHKLSEMKASVKSPNRYICIKCYTELQKEE